MPPAMKLKKRYYFRCEKGAQWMECEWNEGYHVEGNISTDGDWCYVSGCKEHDHKIELVHSFEGDSISDNEYKFKWFKRPEKEKKQCR